MKIDKPNYIRKGNCIYSGDAKEALKAWNARTIFASINEAKRMSRELQASGHSVRVKK